MPPKRKATSSASKSAERTKRTVAGNTSLHTTQSVSKSTKPVSPAASAHDPTIPPNGANGPLAALPFASVANNPGPSTAQTASGDNTYVWEILNGDTRDRLVVNTAATNRLILTFCHRISKQTVKHEYQKEKKKVKKLEDIDWNDPEDIREINIWRNHVFHHKMGFPSKVKKYLWCPYETAYLELVYGAIRKAISVKDHAPMPHESIIFERFNAFFDQRGDIKDKNGNLVPPRGVRDLGSLQSYVQRPGNAIRPHREVIKSSLINKIEDAWDPRITDAEIDSHLATRRTVVPSKKTKVAKVDPSNATGGTANSKPGSSKASPIPAIENLHGPSSAGTANSTMSNTGSSARGSKKPYAPTLPPSTASPKNSSTSSGPEPTLPKPISKPHPYTVITTEEEFQKLRDDGWSVPEFPETDEEALKRHRESENDTSGSDNWHILAEISHENRLERRSELALGYYERNEARLAFYKDPTEVNEDRRKKELACRKKMQSHRGSDEDDRERVEADTGEDTGKATGNDTKGAAKAICTTGGKNRSSDDSEGEVQRRDGAAAANCLLGHATIPPFGYLGNIRDLETNPRFPKSERDLAETNVIALRKFHAAHDKAFDKHE
jgi:hypothetical protein